MFEFDNCLKIATGGYSSIFQKDGLFDIVDDGLSIKGLKHISDINS